ncbi:MAG: TonB-dependent hemoglobin/transferrin/lactoferrin family receptor [Hyphomicrobiaceae bacterium]
MSNKQKVLGTLGALSAALMMSCSSASAQGIQLDGIVVTFSKTMETAIDALAGSSAVNKEQLDEQFQPDSVSEVLRTLPGVTTQNQSKDTAQAINIRGLQDFGRVNVLIDGARQNFQKSDHGANGTFYMEPEMLKRVDITRGPTATIYGSGAIGGVAAFELIDADDILRPGERMAIQSRTRYSSNGPGWMESGTGALKVGNFDVLMQGTGRWNDDYKDGAGRPVPNSADDTYSVLGKARWRPAAGSQITVTALDYRSNFVDSVNSNATGTRLDTDVNNRQFTLGYTFSRPDTPLINFSGKVYHVETGLDQLRLNGSAAGTRRSFNVETDGFDINNTSRFNFGATKIALTYGGDGFQDRVKNFDPGGNGDELTPSGQRNVYGGFLQSRFTFFDTLDIIAAARYDSYELKGGTTHLEGDRISPKLTAAYSIFKGATVFATYAEGYRAPAVTETLIDGSHPPPAPFQLLPNPNLRPETAHNLEAGLNLKYNNVITTGDAFRAKLVVYQNKVDDYIDAISTDPNGDDGTFNGFNSNVFLDDTFQYQNIAKAKIDGVEIEAMYDARTWFFGVGGTHIRGKNADTGAPLLTIPADQITLTAGFRAFEQKLSAGARLHLVDAKDDVPSGTAPTDGFATVDLFAQYVVNDKVTLNLNLDNLLDKAYIQYRDQSYSPGFNARLTMTMRLGAQ